MLPVAVDAVGGDKAPGEIVQGAREAADTFGVPVLLVGPPDRVGDTLGLELVPCTEVIEMKDDPGASVRRKKDSSLVRAAEAVRDGHASALVSAGNTGATMASALLRMGRLQGVQRPAIATPLRSIASCRSAARSSSGIHRLSEQWRRLGLRTSGWCQCGFSRRASSSARRWRG